MSKFVVTVFENENAAYEGSKAMIALDQEGSIALYAGAVITKNAEGEVEIKNAVNEGPVRTATGMLLGTVAGLLAGATAVGVGAAPTAVAAGTAAGFAGGTVGGLFAEAYNGGVDAQFLSDIAELLTPGKAAVIAEISEGWTTPLDSQMNELGGTVFRRYRIDVEDDQIARDIEATDRELEELEQEWDQAMGEAKENLQTKKDAVQARLESLRDRANEKAKALKAESDAKVAKLSQQIETAKQDVKEKFTTQREQMQSDYDVRIAKLKRASELTRDALAV